MEEDFVSTDPLSGLLSRLCCAEWITDVTSFGPHWAIEVPADYLSFYVASAGQFRLRLCQENSSPMTLNPGSFVLLTHGTPHLLCDQIDSPKTPWEETLFPFRRTHDDLLCGTNTTIVHGHFPLASLGRSRFDLHRRPLSSWMFVPHRCSPVSHPCWNY